MEAAEEEAAGVEVGVEAAVALAVEEEAAAVVVEEVVNHSQKFYI